MNKAPCDDAKRFSCEWISLVTLLADTDHDRENRELESFHLSHV